MEADVPLAAVQILRSRFYTISSTNVVLELPSMDM